MTATAYPPLSSPGLVILKSPFSLDISEQA